MKNSLALLTLALTSCSDLPEPVVAAASPLPVPPASRRVRTATLVEESTPAPPSYSTDKDWRFDTIGLSAGVAKLLTRFDDERADTLTNIGLGTGPFSKLLQVPGPRNTTLFAYLRRRFAGDAGCFFVFLEDPATGATTAEPVEYCSTWCAYTDPELRFIDLDGDGVEEIVTMDFFHNGTALNLTVDSYWEVAADLSLRQVLQIARLDESIQLEGEGFGSVSREFQSAERIDGTNTHCIEVTWEPEGDAEARVLGSTTIRLDPETKTWLPDSPHHEGLSEVLAEQLSPMGHRAGGF